MAGITVNRNTARDEFNAKWKRNNRSERPEIEVNEDMYAPRSDYYVATFGAFDLDCLTGRGHTPLDAIVDLLDKAEG